MSYKNIIFDLGAVLITWDPVAILEKFTDCDNERDLLRRGALEHDDWLAMDRGELSDAEALLRFESRTGLSKDRLVDFLLLTKSTLLPIVETVDFMKSLKERGHRLYCLSNMSIECYEYIKHFDFFNCFDGVVVSGYEKLLKPEKEIYVRLLERFGLEAKETFFIDDRQENIVGAAEVGIDGFVFSRGSDSYERLFKVFQMDSL